MNLVAAPQGVSMQSPLFSWCLNLVQFNPCPDLLWSTRLLSWACCNQLLLPVMAAVVPLLYLPQV